MKVYSSYKDSGVEWIGEIPSHWNLSKLKYHTKIISSSIDKKYHESFDKYPIIHYNDIVKNKKIGLHQVVNFGYCSEQQFDSFKVLKGDLIVTKDSMDINNVCDSSIIIENLEMCVFGYHLTKFSVKSSRLIPNYLFYYFNNPMIKKFYLINSNGTTIIGVGKSTFENTPINLPPKETQTQIVLFLDNKTRKIDDLIKKTKKKIALLKEKRTALINTLVTKGLNPHVKMKDSGVEWIGKIPIHWETVKLKYTIKKRPNNGIFKKREEFGDGVPLVNVGDLFNKNNFINKNKLDKVRVDESELEKYEVQNFDVFFVRSSLKLEGIGVSSMIDNIQEPTVFECHIIRVIPEQRTINPYYFNFFLNSYLSRNRLISISQTVTMTTISQEHITSLEILIPPNIEQTQTVKYLDEKTQKIDLSIEKESKRIKLLKEYRSALIAEVVTGKRKVAS